MATTSTKQRAGEQPQPEQPQPEQPQPEQPEQPEQAKPRKRAPRKPRTPQPEPQPALDIAAAVEAEDVSKAQRVYVRIAGPFPQPDNTFAAVDRERRADDTLGEYLLAEIRVGKDKQESAQRFSVARLQQVKTTLEANGLRIFQ